MKLSAVLLVIAIPVALLAVPPAENRTPAPIACDYDGFLELAQRMRTHHDEHLVSLDRFVAMAKEPGTVVLDARSETHFDAVHIASSVNLPYTSFSEKALRERIPNQSTRILIYCRNNLIDSSQEDDGAELDIPFAKGSFLGLNIPTAITLYGYGYRNVWELNSVLDISKPDIKLVGTQVRAK